MYGNRSFPRYAWVLLLLASTTGCATIATAVEAPGNVQRFQGPPADPGPIQPIPPPGAPSTWKTAVANLPGEDLAGPCTYDLYLAHATATLRGVLVIYDRADSRALYADSDLRNLAAALQFGLLLPEQCNAASFPDIQQDALAGPGRALFTALDQFATLAGHPELAKSNVLLFGFSAAGVLAATTADFNPSRILGVIAYDGASAPQQLNTVVPNAEALQIPFLVLSNDQDIDAGTSRDQIFFANGWQQGAPWASGVQHGFGHCCTLSTKPVVLPWIAGIVAARLGGGNSLKPIVTSQGVFNDYACTPNGIEDVTGYENCTVTSASLLPPGSSSASARGWLPDATTGAAWLQWVGH